MSIVIDCSGCPNRTPERDCDDCIVSYLLDRPEGAVIFDVEEERAIRTLRDGGLLPEVKIEHNTG